MTGRAHIIAATALLGLCGAARLPAVESTALAQGASKTATATPAVTSTPSGPPNALQGFSQNRDKPIRIDASRLEVRDKDKVATFFGDAQADVKVVQGDTTMRSRILVVFYEKDDTKTEAKGAAPGPGGSSQVKRLEAKQNVIVTQKDQIVTGDNGVFDMKTNIATVSGNVVMTQCENVVKGDRLIVDMTTGVSRVENNGGRVQSVLMQSQPGGCPTPPPAKR